MCTPGPGLVSICRARRCRSDAVIAASELHNPDISSKRRSHCNNCSDSSSSSSCAGATRAPIDGDDSVGCLVRPRRQRHRHDTLQPLQPLNAVHPSLSQWHIIITYAAELRPSSSLLLPGPCNCTALRSTSVCTFRLPISGAHVGRQRALRDRQTASVFCRDNGYQNHSDSSLRIVSIHSVRCQPRAFVRSFVQCAQRRRLIRPHQGATRQLVISDRGSFSSSSCRSHPSSDDRCSNDKPPTVYY